MIIEWGEKKAWGISAKVIKYKLKTVDLSIMKEEREKKGNFDMTLRNRRLLNE